MGFMSNRPGLNNSQLLASYLSPGKFLNLLEPLFSHLHNSGETVHFLGWLGRGERNPFQWSLARRKYQLTASGVVGGSQFQGGPGFESYDVRLPEPSTCPDLHTGLYASFILCLSAD